MSHCLSCVGRYLNRLSWALLVFSEPTRCQLLVWLPRTEDPSTCAVTHSLSIRVSLLLLDQQARAHTAKLTRLNYCPGTFAVPRPSGAPPLNDVVCAGCISFVFKRPSASSGTVRRQPACYHGCQSLLDVGRSSDQVLRSHGSTVFLGWTPR